MNVRRVFLSYSHDSWEHSEVVLRLAQQLREWGVDARLDRYVAAPPVGWPRWMMAEVEAADFVLLVCTPAYRRRFEGDEPSDHGHGATFEGLLAIQHLYDANARNQKFIPIVFADSPATVIPPVLRAYTYHVLPGGFEALYRHISGQPEIDAAPLGPVRVLPPQNATSVVSSTSVTSLAPRPRTDASVAAATIVSDGSQGSRVEPAELLHRLLISLFGLGETFRRWIALGPYSHIAAELPDSPASVSEVVFGGMRALDRHGLLDTGFFARLTADFPRRHVDIQRVAMFSQAEDGVGGVPDALIHALAEAYPDVSTARALWERAGGKGSEVENIPRPRDLWQRLWIRSTQGASVRPAILLATALREQPNSPVLLHYLKRREHDQR